MVQRRLVTRSLVVLAAVALAVSAASPAAAASKGKKRPAPSPPPAATATCATFEGLSVDANWVNYSNIALKAGESVTARVSPADPVYDINLSWVTGGIAGFEAASASGGLTYTAPLSGTYYLGWSLDSGGRNTAALTWTFDCSSVG